MKQNLTLCFVLALALAGCAAPSDLQPPTPTLPAPPITIVETGSPMAVPFPPTEDTAECGAILTATASATNLILGETMTVTVTHDNRQGCYAIGIPQYSLRFVATEQGTAVDAPAFEPNNPKATLTEGPSSVAVGQMKTVVFEVEALRSGEFFVNTHVSYEYQAAGAEQQPWVWGGDAAQPLVVQVVAFDMTQLPECIPPADLENLGYEWRDCTLTEIEGSDGWAAVQWGRDGCNYPAQLVLVNINTGELRRFTDRPLRDFLGETVSETAVWGDRLLKYQESITREEWLFFSGGCHLSSDSYLFLYDVTADAFRLAPLENNTPTPLPSP